MDTNKAPVAQLVEHSPFKGVVMSSSLIGNKKLLFYWNTSNSTSSYYFLDSNLTCKPV